MQERQGTLNDRNPWRWYHFLQMATYLLFLTFRAGQGNLAFSGELYGYYKEGRVSGDSVTHREYMKLNGGLFLLSLKLGAIGVMSSVCVITRPNNTSGVIHEAELSFSFLRRLNTKHYL